MTELPRKAAARTARLAALPLGYAGRTALGFGKRLGGKPAEAVLTEVQQRTAEQLFRTLGELKGGAMKFGQALSACSRPRCPRSSAAPYREHLTALQDSAPPMPTGDRARAARRAPRRRLARAAGLARRRPDRGGVDRAGAPGPVGTTAARSRSRCSTPARARR